MKADQNNGFFLCPDCGEECLIRAQTESGVCGKCHERLARDAASREALRIETVRLIGGESIFEKSSWEKIEINPLNQKAVEACKAFNFKTDNLFLWGDCGRGKTLLAKAVAREKSLSKAKVIIETTSTLSRKTRGRDGDDEQKMIDRFCDADIFILDDLGRGNVTPVMLSILCEVLDRRFDSDRQGFIATSNLDFPRLALAMGDDRLTSRLLVCRCIEVKGKDWRVQK